jgi:hypothetical protein
VDDEPPFLSPLPFVAVPATQPRRDIPVPSLSAPRALSDRRRGRLVARTKFLQSTMVRIFGAMIRVLSFNKFSDRLMVIAYPKPPEF